jgi:ketosteroid isomerase-like protein
MTERHPPASPELDAAQRAAIEEAVRQAAWQHLKSENAAVALSHYEPDAILASNGSLYPSFERFAEDAREFYRTLRQIDLAAWDEMHVQILGRDAAVLTATVRWSSIDTGGVRTDLKGVWTAVFVRRAEGWKICTRHESFEPVADPS